MYLVYLQRLLIVLEGKLLDFLQLLHVLWKLSIPIDGLMQVSRQMHLLRKQLAHHVIPFQESLRAQVLSQVAKIDRFAQGLPRLFALLHKSCGRHLQYLFQKLWAPLNLCIRQ